VKRINILLAGVFLFTAAQAQDDAEEYVVVLPDDAQKCVLPASPDAIPDDATIDQLKLAKAEVAEFQGKAIAFRECLDAAQDNPGNTDGNKQAIISSYNYSVDMEERVAVRFNEAVRSYKARKAKD
jgi:hypothetical protein